MPICKKCGKDFPKTKTIDGKERVLTSRKFCLTCSPFGLRNTRDLTKPKVVRNKTKRKFICKTCKKEKFEACRATSCNTCRSRAERQKRKKQIVANMGGKCEICGYDKSVAALDFHHRDEKEKKFEISSNLRKKWNELEHELKKCMLICSNCHRELHSDNAAA